jgi:pimeloyl-ACP methyl ester carboxylesterase
MVERIPVHLERGDHRGPTVLLLHGSGATAAVWAPVLAELDRRGRRLDWITVDLPGHGRSGRMPDYHHGRYASAVAAAVVAEMGPSPDAPRVDLVVGHSLGALVALAMADGSHGVEVGAVTAMALKVSWTPEELHRRAALAEREPKTFADREQAAQRFALVSGMNAVPSTDRQLDTGIRRTDHGYQLAADPRITAAPPPAPDELAEVMSRVRAAVRLACGSADPGIDPENMAAVLGLPVRVAPGAGHNLHLDHPALVADMIDTDVPNPT